MSIKILNKILNDVTLEPTLKHVLTVLAYYANDETSECWPSINKLQTATGLSKRTICRALNKLEERQLIIRKKRTTKTGFKLTNCYKIANNLNEQKEKTKMCRRDTSTGVIETHQQSNRCVTVSPTDMTPRHRDVSQCDLPTYIEPKKKDIDLTKEGRDISTSVHARDKKPHQVMSNEVTLAIISLYNQMQSQFPVTRFSDEDKKNYEERVREWQQVQDEDIPSLNDVKTWEFLFNNFLTFLEKDDKNGYDPYKIPPFSFFLKKDYFYRFVNIEPKKPVRAFVRYGVCYATN